jgi:hypothetical protein
MRYFLLQNESLQNTLLALVAFFLLVQREQLVHVLPRSCARWSRPTLWWWLCCRAGLPSPHPRRAGLHSRRDRARPSHPPSASQGVCVCTFIYLHLYFPFHDSGISWEAEGGCELNEEMVSQLQIWTRTSWRWSRRDGRTPSTG